VRQYRVGEEQQVFGAGRWALRRIVEKLRCVDIDDRPATVDLDDTGRPLMAASSMRRGW
jgi:hypothetical protein